MTRILANRGRWMTLVGGFLAAWCLADDAQARTPQRNSGGGGAPSAPRSGYAARRPNPAAQARAMMNRMRQQMIANLKATRDLLQNKVDHDYQGHRVKAIEHIDKAIRTVSTNGTGANNTKPNNGNNKNGNNKGNKGSTSSGSTGSSASGSTVSQKESDARMKQAKQSLQTIWTQLGGHAAQTQVKDAIMELDSALKIK